jgi:hypothetical protein
MTVGELIERLALEDPKMRVVVDGYERGCDEVHDVKYARINLNTRKTDGNWWDGEYDYVLDETAELALVLPRKS